MRAILSVSSYTAAPVETCDRCGQGIKYVCAVKFADGTLQKFGMDCINKVLAGDTSLKKLFTKNRKRLEQLVEFSRVLNLPPEQMPKSQEYYRAGIFFVGSDKGPLLGDRGQSLWHVDVDIARNETSDYSWKRRRHEFPDAETFIAKRRQQHEEGRAHFLAYYTGEIKRIEGFLARVLSKFPELTAEAAK